MSDQDLIDEQIRYYRARALEYDEWYARRGRWDFGPEANRAWAEELQEVREALRQAAPAGRVLEIACGTGFWTRLLTETADSVTALDAASETIELNRKRVQDDNVEYLVADVFRWEPCSDYDFIFFGFWLSHTPERLFSDFWQRLSSWLRPSGRVFFVDNSRPTSAAAARSPLPPPSTTQELRVTNDGESFQIVKVYHAPKSLQRRLENLGWSARVSETPRYFIYGQVTPR